jgi:integrase
MLAKNQVVRIKADQTIRSLPAPEKRREIPDDRITGLYLVVQPSGAKSWAVRYRADGAPRKLTLGPYPAVDLATARKRAQEALGDLARGVDPAARKKAAKEAHRAEQSTADRVDAVAALFVERYAKRTAGPLWARETERLLKVEVIPKLGAKRLGDVKRADIHDLLDGIVDRGSPFTANRTLAVLRRMCNWAIERGIIAASPVDKIKPPAVEDARDRVLSDDEIRLAEGAFGRIGWPFGPIARLLLLTGARRDEIAEGRWSEIDLAAKTWTVVKERSKNGVAHEIPLSDAAVLILQGLPRIGDKKDGFVFTTTGRSPVSGFSRAKAAIDKAIVEALKEQAAERGDDPAEVKAPAGWVLHDMRRTAASGMAGLGIAPHVVEAVLNHRSGTIKGVAAVYNRYSYAPEKRAALEAWARRLETIVTGGAASNVVELSAARG